MFSTKEEQIRILNNRINQLQKYCLNLEKSKQSFDLILQNKIDSIFNENMGQINSRFQYIHGKLEEAFSLMNLTQIKTQALQARTINIENNLVKQCDCLSKDSKCSQKLQTTLTAIKDQVINLPLKMPQPRSIIGNIRNYVNLKEEIKIIDKNQIIDKATEVSFTVGNYTFKVRKYWLRMRIRNVMFLHSNSIFITIKESKNYFDPIDLGLKLGNDMNKDFISITCDQNSINVVNHNMLINNNIYCTKPQKIYSGNRYLPLINPLKIYDQFKSKQSRIRLIYTRQQFTKMYRDSSYFSRLKFIQKVPAIFKCEEEIQEIRILIPTLQNYKDIMEMPLWITLNPNCANCNKQTVTPCNICKQTSNNTSERIKFLRKQQVPIEFYPKIVIALSKNNKILYRRYVGPISTQHQIKSIPTEQILKQNHKNLVYFNLDYALRIQQRLQLNSIQWWRQNNLTKQVEDLKHLVTKQFKYQKIYEWSGGLITQKKTMYKVFKFLKNKTNSDIQPLQHYMVEKVLECPDPKWIIQAPYLNISNKLVKECNVTPQEMIQLRCNKFSIPQLKKLGRRRNSKSMISLAKKYQKVESFLSIETVIKGGTPFNKQSKNELQLIRNKSKSQYLELKTNRPHNKIQKNSLQKGYRNSSRSKPQLNNKVISKNNKKKRRKTQNLSWINQSSK